MADKKDVSHDEHSHA